mmetsp:Transcript_49072/g.88197  ORF Transcript_49072/g.88197 Transcript_49072/m.88197 type:complete len:273 (-) Transcript_49072:35-853(-)
MVVSFQLSQPRCQWISAAWCSVYVSVNLFQLAADDRSGDPLLSGEEERNLHAFFDGHISASEFAWLTALGDWLSLLDGDRLLHEQSDGDEEEEKYLYFVAEGTCEVCLGGRQIAKLGPGSIVGEVEQLCNETSAASYTASAVGSLRCLAVPQKKVQELLERKPHLRHPVQRLLALAVGARGSEASFEARADRRYKALLTAACPLASHPGIAEGVAEFRRRNDVSDDDHQRVWATVPQCKQVEIQKFQLVPEDSRGAAAGFTARPQRERLNHP